MNFLMMAQCEIDNEKYFSISGAMGTPGYITLLFQDLFRVHLVKKCGKLRNILQIGGLNTDVLQINDARHHEKNEANISCILVPGNSELAIIEMMVNEIAAAVAAMQLKWTPDD
ncbi:hypothetical protein HZH68_016135 [Vespula germanica]|uniref:Uncharacterized protein n=1 Tax=Vespula germanica TaxID=30212 RepID=A0A834MQR7_VESGE|nr:hypothetical protein HZH68_016135 [Vespula germanica]